MKKQFVLPTAIALSLSLCAFSTHAARLPKSLSTDTRVKQVAYDPNQVYELVGTYGYQTSIEFENDEMVKVVALGDTIAWQQLPYRNRVFLKPVEDDANTNMTIITTKRTYYFQLTSQKQKTGQSYLVRFVYPSTKITTIKEIPDTATTKPVVSAGTPSSPNINYGYSGDKEAIGLQGVMDDGQFTKFLMKKGADLPQFYRVLPDGTEAMVNAQREGDYWVVKRLSSMFVLRDGNSYICVENLSNPYKRTVTRSTRDGGGA
ncbi:MULTISPECIES: TrbG/VirB9 family P-type conjugative transfer protein [Pseudomonas]|uniref:Outer membrane and periplasm component of type IV secretion of T-DNA complex, has secretin-like domain, VirB9 n=1 Tax=Pseudomonas syringae pv. actinidiae TaxID=103796 RepID=A0A2P0QHI9_PSESF|nr:MULTISPECIES: TrbG/VirB9 family P-type conjugative transfer protein [Pseudomonas]APQ06995.1 mating pair formation protein [Pseudomonas syringae pv. actinidiae]ARO44980.1 Outer membrane and periplasm component of type IV secretion of T-DNA complex, has secretin-like domain, VirB9 [Pseudomonas syringae pv. actinidiae]ARO45085.1 Outer membrane and periplasm component of type IV secretion of T-DNA complex, has secretin-like domain, VirB9 [Pseudomonas syringae pv. actinidiae]ARO45176.1 Outer memb